MRNRMEFEITLPKGVRISDIRIGAIPIDDRWLVTVRENHKNIEQLPLGAARRKYG